MLLLLTIALVLVGAVALVIGFVNDAMFPIYLSIGCSLLAAVVLIVFSRLSRARLGPAAAVAGDDVPSRPAAASGGDFPIVDYEDRRVAEIVPLLADLDRDELEMVRERESDGRNRTTVMRRIDDLMDASADGGDEDEDVDEGEDTLIGAAASFGRDSDDEDEEDELGDEGDDLFPIADYDDLRPGEILPLLAELTPDELEEVADREVDGQNRAAILDRIDDLLGDEEVAPAPKKAAGKKASAKKASAKKVPAKKAPAKKVPATKKTAAKKAPAGKTTAKRAPATKKATATRKTAAKKAPARKTTAKKVPAKRAAR